MIFKIRKRNKNNLEADIFSIAYKQSVDLINQILPKESSTNSIDRRTTEH